MKKSVIFVHFKIKRETEQSEEIRDGVREESVPSPHKSTHWTDLAGEALELHLLQRKIQSDTDKSFGPSPGKGGHQQR